MLDLLVRDGMIIDGTGNPGFYGAVGVEGERVRILRGDLAGVEAARVIDAKGHIVCPGFIDMHAHSGLVMLAEPHHEPKVRQGVTTELIGVDGNSYAPFYSHEDFLRFVELNSGLDGNPPLAGKKWSTVDQYLSMFTDHVAVNVAYILGNSPVRICAMGWDDRPPSAKELANMQAILREGMEEGAFGMSTGLDYPPGSYADTAELIELSREAMRLGVSTIRMCVIAWGIASSIHLKKPWRSASRAAFQSTSRIFTSAPPALAARQACWAWSRMRAMAGWMSPSIVIPTNTAAPGCSSYPAVGAQWWPRASEGGAALA